MEDLKLLRALKFFIDNPYEEMYLRELARKMKLSPYSIKQYADFLLKKDLIKEERKANLRYFKANMNNLFFKHLKIASNIYSLSEIDFVEFLKENISNVSSIVLFGSMAKGENDKNSDVDLVIIGNKKKLSVNDFGDKINKDINVRIFSWSDWNEIADKDKAFYSEVITYGIPLFGELPIVK